MRCALHEPRTVSHPLQMVEVPVHILPGQNKGDQADCADYEMSLFQIGPLPQQPSHNRPNILSHILALQRQRQGRLNKAHLRAAVIAPPGKGYRVERLGADHLGHGVGQLDFAACALLLAFEHPHDFGLEDIAARDDQV